MQRQVDALQAKTTERGIVLTLGDVLFTSGRADLKAGAAANLGRLVHFLKENADRKVEIEGHTDNVGSDDYNQSLSQRRADSVKSFLMQQGIGSDRIVASGKGEHRPREVAEKCADDGGCDVLVCDFKRPQLPAISDLLDQWHHHKLKQSGLP
jgi:outer membrane protein OmpA-like peptidoglycan-associated protein